MVKGLESDFVFIERRGLELCVYRPWYEAGLVHGMTTTALSFSATTLGACASELCAAIGASELALAQQCHGAGVLDLREWPAVQKMRQEFGDLLRHAQADIVLAPYQSELREAPIAYGVMTADCVPIILRSGSGYAVVHAGWRGLACGAIRAGVDALGEVQEALIFPSAGGGRYEVGEEVLAAIGETAIYAHTSNSGGKYLLDTGMTALQQLRALVPGSVCRIAGICTIENERFHSFRRDGAAAGRGVTFVAPGASW
jgi:copper oxidase (laccase) domain-containing protein